MLMSQAMKDDAFQYRGYVLCCVDDVFSVSHRYLNTMKVIQSKFKLNKNKMEEPDIYIGSELSKMDKDRGEKLWDMSLDK